MFSFANLAVSSLAYFLASAELPYVPCDDVLLEVVLLLSSLLSVFTSSFLVVALLLFEAVLLLLVGLLLTDPLLSLDLLLSDLGVLEEDELLPSLESLFSLYFSSSLFSFDLDLESSLSLVFDEDTSVVSLSFFLLELSPPVK